MNHIETLRDVLAAVFCFSMIAFLMAISLFGCANVQPFRDARGCTGIEPGTCMKQEPAEDTFTVLGRV